ncbi:hypothetical protein GUJ93_ZPchr0002g24175 [Zizania palustris]|uniref:Pentacotripeptide-repeat region of PRORP domain-containing protein n=1 Tax=Zizania palustris TaxID=103762 RepID=A0A8J5VRN7_ZIZPA|nr:hypothetical protein GUJ93_ZPchr0002g24175 [Zizania palustris]
MGEKGLRLSEKTFAALMPGLCDDEGRAVEAQKAMGDLDGALEVHPKSGQFKHVLVNPRPYGVLMEGLCAGGKCDCAVEVLDELLDKATLLSPKSPLMNKGVDEGTAFNSLIRGHAKEGVPEAAHEILTIMTCHGVPTDPESHALLVDYFLIKNKQADAKVMKGMIEKGITENMDMAHKILEAEALFIRGHVEEAIGRVNLMLENGCLPDLDKLPVSLCENDRVMEAHKLADFALDRDFDVSFSTYDRVLEALYTEENTLPAYSMLCKIKNKGGFVDQKGCDAMMESIKAGGYSK